MEQKVGVSKKPWKLLKESIIRLSSTQIYRGGGLGLIEAR